jgi:uncharacterized membrane protein YvbJ
VRGPYSRAIVNEAPAFATRPLQTKKGIAMRSILLWALGVPVSLIIIIGLFTHF